MLVEGKWTEDWQPVQAADTEGRFLRQNSSFRGWLTPDGGPGPEGQKGFLAEPGRYRLIVALICPWASRTLIARALKRLEDVLPVTVVQPELGAQGWRFDPADPEPQYAAGHVHELYSRDDPKFTGRATVPVLWDSQTSRIVNNESADILRMLDTAFSKHVSATPSLRPAKLAGKIDALTELMYHSFNNGVYRAGFAGSQRAFDEASSAVFDFLDRMETRLQGAGPFLFGEVLTEADVRFFVTLVRFDAAYHGLFHLQLRRVADFPCVGALMARMLAMPEIRRTVDIDHIMRGYSSIRAINPAGIAPPVPAHLRALLDATASGRPA